MPIKKYTSIPDTKAAINLSFGPTFLVKSSKIPPRNTGVEAIKNLK